MLSSIIVEPATTARQRRAFLLFSWRIYKGDPNWVPPILNERAARLDPRHNPLFQHGEAQPFVAVRDGRLVGTIAAAVDARANQQRSEQVATFGFFECVDDYAVAQALFERVVGWARERGLTTLRGPQSFGPNDEPGLLIEGRGTPPVLMMGWTPPYYVDLVERYGFRKWADSLAYRMYRSDLPTGEGNPSTGRRGEPVAYPEPRRREPSGPREVLPAKMVRVAEYARRRYGYTIRHADVARWDAEMESARDIYNRSLAVLWDFVPLEEREWREQAEKLRPLLDPDFAIFAQVDGREVGFGLGLPDLNQALRHCNGLRYPWNYLPLWWHSRRLPGLSFKILALLPEYWGRGLDALIYLEMARQTLRKGYQWMDMSLTGEDNPMTNRLATNIGAKVDKRYRIYELEVTR
jgi:GNAT superfamily N-acetyltransferase